MIKRHFYQEILTNIFQLNFLFGQETLTKKIDVRGHEEDLSYEGRLHKLLKNSATKKLLVQNYRLCYEPLESTLSRLSWYSYRPDILGVLLDEDDLRVVLVECETKPDKKRVLEKFYR